MDSSLARLDGFTDAMRDRLAAAAQDAPESEMGAFDVSAALPAIPPITLALWGHLVATLLLDRTLGITTLGVSLDADAPLDYGAVASGVRCGGRGALVWRRAWLAYFCVRCARVDCPCFPFGVLDHYRFCDPLFTFDFPEWVQYFVSPVKVFYQ